MYCARRAARPRSLFGVLTLLALVLVSCQSAPPSASKAVAPAASSTAAPAAGSAPASRASAEWDRVLAEAKREGTICISLPAGVPGLGEAFAQLAIQAGRWAEPVAVTREWASG
jgi:hypothetical protein